MLTKRPKGIALEIIKTMKHPLADGGPLDDMPEHEDDEDEGSDEHLKLLAGDVYDAAQDQDEQGFAEALITLIKSC